VLDWVCPKPSSAFNPIGGANKLVTGMVEEVCCDLKSSGVLSANSKSAPHMIAAQGLSDFQCIHYLARCESLKQAQNI
jgi:hypothetical protein